MQGGPADLLPVFLDIEGPLELQMRLVVVVDELRDSFIVASTNHTRWRCVGLDCGID